MSFDRPLRGGCHCGRNLYIIQFPKNYTHNPASSTTTNQQTAQVLFNSHPSHLSALGTPLPSYLRVPLTWYHTLTVPYHPDESRVQIRRVYDDDERRTKRHFCGFCGTPLSYWTEEPRGEGEFIQLTLGSLWSEDLGGLEEMGFLNLSGGSDTDSGSEGGSPSGCRDGEDREEAVMDGGKAGSDVARTGDGLMGRIGTLPWFDTLTEGSRLGRLRRAKGGSTNRLGTTVRVEWEVVEWSEDETGGESPRKRKLDEVEGVVEVGRREGVQP